MEEAVQGEGPGGQLGVGQPSCLVLEWAGRETLLIIFLKNGNILDFLLISLHFQEE